MAEHQAAATDDFTSHERTYVSFVKLIKWSVIVVVIILLLMAYFLT